MGNGLSLAVAVAVPVVSGSISGLITVKEIPKWYRKLRKPSWTPPDRLFGVMWPVLYTCMGVASWLVWKHPAQRLLPLGLYGAQLALNLAWTPLFFKAHKLDLALADISALVGVATAATVSMARVAGPKAVLPLMGPYLAWLTYATALNYDIMKKNPDAEKLGQEESDVQLPSKTK